MIIIIAMHRDLKAVGRLASRSGYFMANNTYSTYTAHTQELLLPAKTLTSSLDSATEISRKRALKFVDRTWDLQLLRSCVARISSTSLVFVPRDAVTCNNTLLSSSLWSLCFSAVELHHKNQ